MFLSGEVLITLDTIESTLGNNREGGSLRMEHFMEYFWTEEGSLFYLYQYISLSKKASGAKKPCHVRVLMTLIRSLHRNDVILSPTMTNRDIPSKMWLPYKTRAWKHLDWRWNPRDRKREKKMKKSSARASPAAEEEKWWESKNSSPYFVLQTFFSSLGLSLPLESLSLLDWQHKDNCKRSRHKSSWI